MIRLLTYKLACFFTVMPIALIVYILEILAMSLASIGEVLQAIWQRMFFDAPKAGEVCPDCGEVHEPEPPKDVS